MTPFYFKNNIHLAVFYYSNNNKGCIMPIYIKINDIEGNITAKNHEKWIEVNSINFYVSRNITTKPGAISDREFTKPSLSEIEITKNIDKTSPLLFSEACVGKVKNVNIDVCQTNETISAYMQYTLSNVIISHYSVLIHSEDDKHLLPTEKIKLNFSKIEMKYIPYDEKHNAGSPIPAGYDLESAKKV